MYKSMGWFVVNLLLNVVYIADTVMQFFRAYYDADGRIVYGLRTIARNYFFSRKFILDFIASFPMQVNGYSSVIFTEFLVLFSHKAIIYFWALSACHL